MDNLFQEKDFISIDKEHLIKTSITDDIGWFQIININFEKYKTFFLLVKDCIDYYRNNNIKYIKQYISLADVESFKYSETIQINDSMYTVTTPIINFIDELVNVLDIKLI